MHPLHRRLAIACALASTGIIAGLPARSQTPSSQRAVVAAGNQTEWVAGALKRMQTVKVGMTRAQLLSVFTIEGGLSTPSWQTFVYRDCPYIKVDVKFHPLGRGAPDRNGRRSMTESSADIITAISKPYLAWSVAD